jgi:hypothetical protein
MELQEAQAAGEAATAAPEAAAEATPARHAPPPAGAAFSASKEPDAQQLLERLHEDVLKKGAARTLRMCCMAGLLKHEPRLSLGGCAGGTWDERWRVESKMRTSGNTAGTWDSVSSRRAA